jgi:hypothetical protein
MHQLINRSGQCQQILLDGEVENISVLDVDRYCHDSISYKPWLSRAEMAELTAQFISNLLDSFELLVCEPMP